VETNAFPKPAFTADALVLAGCGRDMSLLVVERANEPAKGLFALPGGFVDPGEPPLLAALRELSEETGLELALYEAEPLTIRGRQGRDPRGWTLSQPYLFHLPEVRPVSAGDDARRAIWLPLTDLQELAFDHGAMLCEALGCFWPRMPTFRPRLAGIEPFGGSGPNGAEVTFYGGSFHPWHAGHGACVDLFPHPDKLVIVPDFSPFKERSPLHCQWRFLRQIAARTAASGCAVFPGFCGRETPNPTVGWLPRADYASIGFLVGEDNLVSLPRWQGAATLLHRLQHVYVAPRRAAAVDLKAARAWISDTHPGLKVTYLDDHAYRDLSSTGLRATTDDPIRGG